MTRFYHSVNTRYNIHYNADIAYKESLEAKERNREDNLSQLLHIFPQNSSDSVSSSSGSFTTTIDKTTKAIKLHSIKARPKRDPNRRNDADYQAWLRQKEFTPFMDQVWLLLAKAEFQDGNYLQSVSTFLYITKIYSSNPDIVAECQLWIARAYTEMGWMYEAGNVLHKMEIDGGPPEKHKGLYSLVKANYLVYNNEYQAAVPQLELAIKKEKNKLQQIRMKYLLGQLYAQMGDKEKADKAFASVKGMSTPYKYTFNAQLQQVKLDDSLDKTKALSKLSGMTKGSKNKEYLDQVYFAIGDIYLEKKDSVKAIDNYKLAVEKSTRNGYDKAMVQVRLGDIYFTRREFVLAQPCYSEALPLLAKSHDDYPRVALRSGVLDELVVFVKTVQEQDSLQHLAQLPEDERLQIINDKIEKLRKEDEKQKKEEETQKRIEERADRISSWDDIQESLLEPQKQTTVAQIPTQQSTGSFYFYNEQAVNQGKVAFQQRWGNRKLEDDWRRRNKQSTGFSDMDLANETDSVHTDIAELKTPDGDTDNSKNVIEDVYSVDYYLQQLPLTLEAIEESNELIENALYNMGLIYKDKLGDIALAIDAFNMDIYRFPNTPNLEEIYYQLLLIYMRLGDRDMMATYRSRLMNYFPSGKYAGPVSQPDYEWNFRHMANLQDSLYNEAYSAYKRADVATVRRNYTAMDTKYPFTDLMPNFTLLNALTYAQVRDAGNLEISLTDLVKKYPKSDVTPLASDILDRIKDGKILLSDGSPITDFDWSKAYESADSLLASKGKVLQYSDTLDVPYMLLLMFKPRTIDRNELLYQVADYNFSNYVIQTFDLSFDTDPPYEVLQMKGFNSFAAIRSYLSRAYNENGLVHHIDTSILVVPISTDNYINVLPRLGLAQYMAYFSEHFADQFPQLIASWNGVEYVAPVDPEIAEAARPDEAGNEEPDTTKEPVTETEPVKEPVIISKTEEKPVEKQPDKPTDTKQITADDLLTKDQLEKVGQVNDVVEDIENIVNNPVDGIKSLFGRYKNRENLTKEEKAAQKEEEKQRKQLEKEQKAIAKAYQDSIQKVEKNRTDSIARVEKALEDSIKTAKKQAEEQKRLEEKQKEEAAKAAVKAKEDARKQKEEERKEKERLQKERLRQREKERKEKEKAREQERKEKEKQAEERRKQREKERG
ncbi:tetratricopeptide repeat protein [Dysgonomonas sp. 521]|uniref:type IX secretion system periplasmic lipoprotein PorW/SprE n=1 Tax=Dysgonomonas sp. 521 TaxID=2302932 RepID=UPI002104401D|nr:tetratricopeptide repeat protein [Dysgonomonas sp. 521]